jgi:Secretion system C-terminal sorting domain
VMSAYSGACGSLTLITCNDDGNPESGPSAAHSRITLSGRIPGEEIFLRVTPFSAASEEQFAICAWDETPGILPAIAPGGNCINGVTRSIDSTQGNIYMWVPVYDNSGNIIAELYSDGNNLGTITPDLFVNSGAIRQFNGKFYLDRNITLQVSNPPSSMVKIRWYLKNTELTALQTADPSVTAIGDLVALKTSTVCQPAYTGSGITVNTIAGAYGGDHYLQGQVSSFSSFYFDRNAATLPVLLESFVAYAAGRYNEVRWQLSGTDEVREMMVERSSDGIRFIPVYSLTTPAGATTSRFGFTDSGVLNSVYYYRLRIRQLSGREIISAQRQVKRSEAAKTTVQTWPNPVNDQLQLLLSGRRITTVTIRLYNCSGMLIANRQLVNADGNLFILKTTNLPAGLYILETTLPQSGEKIISRIIKN